MDKLYTIGELAKLAGVSARTIRFYDKKGILKPCGYNEEDYRLYDTNSVIVLQQILMLKYVGFSLEEIGELIRQDSDASMKEILERQKELMLQKRSQMDRIIYALDSAVESYEKNTPDLQHFTEIMQLITKNDHASWRYGLYEKYNPKQMEWFIWRFEVLGLKDNMKILDVGCGHGLIWTKNWERIPSGCKVVLLDKARNGLEYLKKYYGDNKNLLADGVCFEFVEADAENWIYFKNTYDCILTNHFWEYVENKKDLMKQLYGAIKDGGILSSTIASLPQIENIRVLLEQFVSKEVLQQFNREKIQRKQQLETLFAEIFDVVEDKVFNNYLVINQAEDVYNYLISENSKVKQLLERKNTALLGSLKLYVQKHGQVTIGIDGHLYICRKQVQI